MDEHPDSQDNERPEPSTGWTLYNEASDGSPTEEVTPVTAPTPQVSSTPPAGTPTTPSVGASTPPPGGTTPPPTGGAYVPPPFQGPTPVATSSSRKGIAAAVAVGAAAAFIGVGLGHFAWGDSPTADVSHSSATAPFGSGDSGQSQDPSGSSDSSGSSSSSGTSSSAAVSAVASKVNPAIVDINTNLGYESASAAGTGIVLNSNGTVLTNNHVINGATQITATDIGNGKTYKATVVGYDRSSDVAVIQLQNASGLATANLGDSRTASVGQSVIGIGNAGGAGGTPSTAAGTITALNQSITASDQSSSTSEQLSGLIQTNAPIQPGDSGGPLVTMRGVVIGMNTAASSNFEFSGSSSSATQGFSIPINSALAIAHQITSGKASDSIHLGATGFMGVQVQAANSSTDPFNSQGGSQSSTTGVSVVGAVSGSPADKAGLGQGDTIVSVNGKTISTPEQLSAIVSRFRPGNTITLVWQDSSGSTHTSAITLAVGPAA